MHKATKLAEQGLLKERDEIVDQKVLQWCTTLLRLAGVKVHVEGKENIPKEPAIFVGNHQGYFDIPILLTSLDRPHGFISKIEVMKIPLVRTWMKHLNCVFIDRKNPRQSVTALNQTADYLKQGYSTVIFPEGTRSKGGPIGEFKPGGFKIAYKSGAPIVPIAMNGSYRIMEQNNSWIKPAEVTVRILSPIETKNLSKQEVNQLAKTVEDLIKENQPQ